MNRLAIFDIDGTLTDTTGVDDDCYCQSVGEALGKPTSEIDWSGALHVTDSGIFSWLCETHGLPRPGEADVAGARSRFVERLTAKLRAEPHRFNPIPGAAEALFVLDAGGWRIAVATGGWGPSARLKLKAASIEIPDEVFACADDAMTRAEIVSLARSRAEAYYGCRFDRVVSLGDGLWDVATAAALRLPFIGIASGERAAKLRAAGAGIVLENYTDLVAVHRSLETAPIPKASSP